MFRFWHNHAPQVPRNRGSRQFRRIALGLALAAVCSAAPASDRDIDRVEVSGEHTGGTSLYSVRGQVATGRDFAGGREFVQVGILAIDSDRVGNGAAFDVGAGIYWPWPLSPNIALGLVGGSTNINENDEEDDVRELNRVGYYGEAGLRLQPAGPVSVKLTGKHYQFDHRHGRNAGVSVIGIGLQFDMR